MPGAQASTAQALQVMSRMAEAVLASQGQRTEFWDSRDPLDGEGQIPGCRGAMAMERFRTTFRRNPQSISAQVRQNRSVQMTGPAFEEGTVASTRNYFAKEVPFGAAKSCAYLLFGLAEVFDLMEAGRWHEAEAQVALLLVAGEHAALREWKWNHAWLLTHLPEPPWAAIGRKPQRDSVRPLSRLAAPAWTAAVIGYAKDVTALLEAERKTGPPPTTPTNPPPGGKGNPKGKGAPNSDE